MDSLPNQDSDEMGKLIDQYLADRRQSGWNSRQIQREAQYLGEVAANEWAPSYGARQRAVQRFVRWREGVTRKSGLRC